MNDNISIDVFPRKKDFQSLLELYPIQKANKFLPEWYKNSKRGKKSDEFGINAPLPHAKRCPAIQEEITNGYILPAWADFHIEILDGQVSLDMPLSEKLWVDNLGEPNSWQWIGSHARGQIKLMNLNTHEEGILKLLSPYFFKTPKGYGTAIRPLPYHFSPHIRLLPGMVDTDIWHEINFPFEFTLPLDFKKDKTKFTIEAGEPLAMITPFKKEEDFVVNNKDFDKDFLNTQNKNDVYMKSISHDWNRYKATIDKISKST